MANNKNLRPHQSIFSADKDWEKETNKVRVHRAFGREVRLTKSNKAQVDKEVSGSAYARLTVALEKTIDKPIKVDGREVYLYSEGRWKVTEGGLDRFRKKAWKVQEPANRNDTTTQKLLNCLRDRNQLEEEERFYGAIRYIEGESFYLLNCADEVLKIDYQSGVVLEHLPQSPDYMFSGKLAANYHEDEKPTCKKFKETLAEVLPDEADRALLLLWFAYCLLPDCRLEVALICVGTGGNGKSIIAKAMMDTLGKENCLTLTLKQICSNDQKQMHRLRNKLVNIGTETEVRAIEENTTFKSIVSGEGFESGKMYESGLLIETSIKLNILANHTPIFKGGSEAEARRIRTIYYPNTFEDEKRNTLLSRQLATEKEGILRLLIDQLPKVAIIKQLPFGSHYSREVYDEFAISNNPIGSFINVCLQTTDNWQDHVFKGDMWKCFIVYMRENNITNYPDDIGVFFSQLYKMKPELRDRRGLQRVNYRIGKKDRIIRKVRLTAKAREIIRGTRKHTQTAANPTQSTP
jgi:P4 family phage/plasmid primase-like protien